MLGLLDDLASTDPHLERHATVVTGYALRLASAMRIPADRMSALVHACRLYHLGQSAAGEGPAHPVLGAELLRAFPLPEQTLTAVRHFRERWDGGGYPQGLAGAEIPQLARLLALVDGYVSLALDPAEPLPHSGALALVRARAGTAYDPAVVDAFSRLHEAAATE
jgi:HD-GYP domain-containing protein (c-di-GMP phosphodiesterase class II)